MRQAAIAIDRLHLRVAGQTLLSDFSLRLEPGDRVCLSGPSGCGKSTLLRTLLGFNEPAGGSITVFGEELNSLSVWRLRRRMTLVDQEPALGEGTVSSLLQGPFRYKNNRQLQDNLARVPELLARLRLPSTLGDKTISSLSGGEKQRLALLAALLLQRDILLLDEPTSALDREAAQAVLELLHAQSGLTMLTVCHDPAWAAAFGRVVDLGGLRREAR